VSLHSFELRVPDPILDDLRARLGRTRFEPDDDAVDWEAGTSPAYLRQLIRYWRTSFDWRAQEAQLNAFPHFPIASNSARVDA